MKIIIVINPVCTCIRTSAEDDDCQREVCVCVLGGGGRVHLMIFSNLRGFMFWSVRYHILLGQFGVARY